MGQGNQASGTFAAGSSQALCSATAADAFKEFAGRLAADRLSPADICELEAHLPAAVTGPMWRVLGAECRWVAEEALCVDPILDYEPSRSKGRHAARAAPRRNAAGQRQAGAMYARDDDDPLERIPAPIYVEAFTGRDVGRDGKMCCPLHDDRTPSMHVYPDGRGWYCYGCGVGGGIYQLAAFLGGYRLPLRGDDFRAVREVLLEHFGSNKVA